jgi:hypothetical protein
VRLVRWQRPPTPLRPPPSADRTRLCRGHRPTASGHKQRSCASRERMGFGSLSGYGLSERCPGRAFRQPRCITTTHPCGGGSADCRVGALANVAGIGADPMTSRFSVIHRGFLADFGGRLWTQRCWSEALWRPGSSRAVCTVRGILAGWTQNRRLREGRVSRARSVLSLLRRSRDYLPRSLHPICDQSVTPTPAFLVAMPWIMAVTLLRLHTNCEPGA